MDSATATLEHYGSALTALADLPTDISILRSLDDIQLLEAMRLHTDASRLLGSAGAALAGELAHRSRPALGNDGLARRTGHRTVDILLRTTTGGSRENVSTVLAAGTLLVEAADDGAVDTVTGEVYTSTQPWLRELAREVAAGRVSIAASRSIGAGLGAPNSAVSAADLESATAQLVAAALAGLDSDRLFTAARELRTELDLDGVRVREEELHKNRSLRHFALPSGGGRAIWDMDTETYATFVATYDRMVSPKLGGIRFVDPERAAHADRIRDDDRTPVQLASDGFLHLIVAGADADSSQLLGSGAPVIRITVAEPSLSTGVGLARIDGQSAPISVTAAERLLCTGTAITMRVDSFGNVIDIEAEQRLFSRRQNEALAAKFGGCMDPNCDRPPSWSESHHIRHWRRDHGKTVIANGILLCKYHHLLYHNKGYEIEVDGQGRYWKIPPTSLDPAQTPIAMPLKTRNFADLAAAAARASSVDSGAGDGANDGVERVTEIGAKEVA